MKKFNLLFLACFVLGINIGIGQQTDWLKWQGPSANGSSPETNWDPNSLSGENSILWKTNVGMGHSAVAVHGDKLYTMGNFEVSENKFQDKIVCLNTNTGKEIWNYSYDCKEMEDPGPFSTPVLNEKKLYSISREGHLFCLNAENGSVLWNKELLKDSITREGSYFACSPVIFEDMLILNLNKKGITFNKNTGDIIWNSEMSVAVT